MAGRPRPGLPPPSRSETGCRRSSRTSVPTTQASRQAEQCSLGFRLATYALTGAHGSRTDRLAIRFSRCRASELAYPDIAKAHSACMVLQYQRLLEIVFLIRLWSDVYGRPPELDVIMNQHAVVN